MVRTVVGDVGHYEGIAVGFGVSPRYGLPRLVLGVSQAPIEALTGNSIVAIVIALISVVEPLIFVLAGEVHFGLISGKDEPVSANALMVESRSCNVIVSMAVAARDVLRVQG